MLPTEAGAVNSTRKVSRATFMTKSAENSETKNAGTKRIDPRHCDLKCPDLNYADPIPALTIPIIREAMPADFPRLLELNKAWVRFLSPLDEAALSALYEQCAYRMVAEVKIAEVDDRSIVGFMLALCPGKAYESPNYRWFSEQLEEFLYIDRIVVDGEYQGRGISHALYNHVVAWARGTGFKTVTCEIDSDPPNERSSAFHDKFGFVEIGTQWVAGGAKKVSLRSLKL